jgi:hypothetical protein
MVGKIKHSVDLKDKPIGKTDIHLRKNLNYACNAMEISKTEPICCKTLQFINLLDTILSFQTIT